MREIIVDSFAGGGGASTGIEMVLGRSPDIAINHDAVALAMHEVNHPQTVHLTADIWSVDPIEATGGRPVGLLWASPDCRHFSKAKGGKPVKKEIRSLAWVVVHWANRVSPRVIILENVEEFRDWGPLVDDRPCPDRKGQTFKRWVSQLTRLGYAVEWRELRACDYGAPTIRKRLFLIARRDGLPITWPAPTHGDPKLDAVKSGALLPWRTAAEIIDWSLPCPSIFDSAEEIFAKYGLRAIRPLQPATLSRLAKGTRRYVVDAAEPFIVRTDMASGAPRNGVHGRREPIRTATSAQSFALAQPYVANLTHQGGARSESLQDPLRTATAAHRGEKALLEPFIAGLAHGDSGGRRAYEGREPLTTIHAKGNNHALVEPFIAGVGGRMGQSEARDVGRPAQTLTAKADSVLVAPFVSAAQQGGSNRAAAAPLHTATASDGDQNQVIAAHMMTMRNAESPCSDADRPARTATAGGARETIVAAFMAQNNYLEPGHAAIEPVSTIVGTGSTQSLAAVNLLRQFGTGVGSSVDEPARTVMADGQGKTQLAAAFLQKYYASDQNPELAEPLHTATTKARFGIAEAMIEIPPFGQEHHARARQVADLLRAHGLWDQREFVTVEIAGITCVIVDLGMRMLTPRELFRAQGFPDGYVIDRMPDGRAITKTEQVSKCGNSVCPPIAGALVKANFRPDEVEPGPEFLEAAE
jgi:DNA (cytosine-5)-methyltransferase 1